MKRSIQKDPDIDFNREKYWNERMKREFNKEDKPIDIMRAAKKPCSGESGEDYSCGGPMREYNGRYR